MIEPGGGKVLSTQGDRSRSTFYPDIALFRVASDRLVTGDWRSSGTAIFQNHHQALQTCIITASPVDWWRFDFRAK